MITRYKKRVEPLVGIIAKPFLIFHPNVLTIIGLLFPLLFFFFLIRHAYTLALVISIGFLFDAIDGYVARKKGTHSLFGKVLDSTVDRISDFLCVSAFGFAGIVSWSLVLSLLLSFFLISYIQAATDQYAKLEGLMQRSERLLFLLVSLLLFILFHSSSLLSFLFTILLVLCWITILQRLLTAKNILKKHE